MGDRKKKLTWQLTATWIASIFFQQEKTMNAINVSLRNACSLSSELKTAQAAIQLPAVRGRQFPPNPLAVLPK